MMAMENYILAFGVGDHLHEPFSLDMESPMSSSEASTGYLEDAVVEWSERSKRRRIVSPLSFDPSVTSMTSAAAEDIQELLQVFWGTNCGGSAYGDLDSLFQESSIVSDENNFNFWEEETETEKRVAKAETEKHFSSSHEIYSTILPNEMNTHDSSTKKQNEKENGERTTMKRRKKRVAYPFAVLKPAGLKEGEVTLSEINERLLMRPTKPVRHPVGEFKCLPCVQDVAGGPGLSGKAVVGLTRIHTQGRGTITIIRTRG